MSLTAATLYGWGRPRFYEASRPITFANIPDLLLEAEGEGDMAMLSMRWFDHASDRDRWMAGEGRAEIPYRYWWWFDVDHADDTIAFREGAAFWRWDLGEEHGLTAGADFVPMVSGKKGMKFAATALTGPGLRWAEAFAWWTRSATARYCGTLDPAMATQDVTRAPGARHRTVTAWQNPIPIHARGAFPADLRRLAAKPLPIEERLHLLPDPTRAPSPNAEQFLREVLDLYAIDRLLIDLPAERRPRGRTGAQIDWTSPLHNAGILKARFEKHGRTGWRLTSCPVCGRKTSNPYVTQWGRLYCFSVSCDAFRAADDRSIGGVPASKWMPGANVKGTGQAGPSAPSPASPVYRDRPETTKLEIDAARAALRDGIARAFDRLEPGRLTVLRSTPGIGKTHAALEALAATWSSDPEKAQALGWTRTMIATETHALADELSLRLAGALPFFLGRRNVVMHVTGRNEKNCAYPKQVAVLGGRGWDPARYFCSRCPSKEVCGYYRMIRAASKASFVVTTWESAAALVDSDQAGKFGRVVYDEDPTRALILEVGLDPNELVALEGDGGGGFGEPAIRAASSLLLRTMRLAATAPQPGKRRPAYHLRGRQFHELIEVAFRQLQGEGIYDQDYADAGALLTDASWACDRIEPGPGFFAPKRKPKPGRAYGELVGGDVDAINRFPARNTLRVIDTVAQDHRRWESLRCADFLGRAVLGWASGSAPRIDAFILRRPASFLPDVILDAYADAAMYRAAWGVPVDVVDVEASMPTAAFVRVPVSTSKRAFRDPKKSAAAWTALQELMAMLRAEGHRRILILTHKAIVSEVYRRFPELKALRESNVELPPVRWFWQGRGIDGYRDWTAVISFGEPEVPPEAAIRRAQALFGGDEKPLVLGAGDDHVRILADPRLRAVQEYFREGELAQSIQRIRLALPPVDPRKTATGVAHLFDRPSHRKVAVVVGRLDTHLLPKPLDTTEAYIRLAGAHVAILRHHGATVAQLSPDLVGWRATAGWKPTRNDYRRIDGALTLACEITGAERIKFILPEWSSGPGVAHVSYTWQERYPLGHRLAPGALHTISRPSPPDDMAAVVGEVERREQITRPPPRRMVGLRLPDDPRCPGDVLPTALVDAVMDLDGLVEPVQLRKRASILLHAAAAADEWSIERQGWPSK